MDTILLLKTSEIKKNLLDLMTIIVDYERRRSGQQLDNKILINKSVFETIQDFIPKIERNVKILSQIIDNKVEENQRLNEELSQYKKRQNNSERQIQELRKLYHNLKEEMDWKETCDQMIGSVAEHNKEPKVEVNKLNNYLKTTLSLIYNSSLNQRTVQSFMENQEVFQDFMASIRGVISDYIKHLLTNDSEDYHNFDPKFIEIICSFLGNVFQCNDYSGEDIPQWIDCLTVLQDIDKQFRRCATMALINVCFAPNGCEELQKKCGIIELFVKCLTDSEFKHDFKLKTNIVKVIRLMIDNSKDITIRLKLYNEFTQFIPFERFQQMIGSEQYIQLRKGMAALLNTFTNIERTED